MNSLQCCCFISITFTLARDTSQKDIKLEDRVLGFVDRGKLKKNKQLQTPIRT